MIRDAASEIAAERDTAIRQAADAVDQERQRIVRDGSAVIAAERGAAISQLGTAVRAERVAMVSDVESAAQRLTDRLFWLGMVLILTGVVCVKIVYRGA